MPELRVLVDGGGETGALEGVRVLLIEDEAIIAMTAEDMLEELGCEMAATASTLAEAAEAVEAGGYDIVLLDINLNGAESLPLAARLREMGRAFIFTTGYGTAGSGAGYDDVPLVTKPYQMGDLEAAIRRALGSPPRDGEDLLSSCPIPPEPR
jgi:CheY-like chemotaxis protein